MVACIVGMHIQICEIVLGGTLVVRLKITDSVLNVVCPIDIMAAWCWHSKRGQTQFAGWKEQCRLEDSSRMVVTRHVHEREQIVYLVTLSNDPSSTLVYLS